MDAKHNDDGDKRAIDDWLSSNNIGFIGHRRESHGALYSHSEISVNVSSSTCHRFIISYILGDVSKMLAALRRSSLPLRFTRQRLYATVSNPQTLVEKIVQKYAVDLAPSAKVRAGDYVMIKPEHV